MIFKGLIPNFTEENYKHLVRELNLGLYKLDLGDNFDGQIVTQEKIATGNFSVGHTLKRVPKYRIILRQIGGGAIVDTTTPWTDSQIYLNNPGSTITLLTLLII